MDILCYNGGSEGPRPGQAATHSKQREFGMDVTSKREDRHMAITSNRSLLRPAQIRALMGRINPARVQTRKVSGVELSYVAAWEFKGVGAKPELHKEALEFEEVHPTQRSYK